MIDLLPLIEVEKDAVNGKWVLNKGMLESDRSERSCIQLPYRPPEEYDFRIVFKRLDGDSGMWRNSWQNQSGQFFG